MPYSRSMIAVALLALAGCAALRGEPEGHGPGWIERPSPLLIEKLGEPDRQVRLPSPSLTTVYLYTGGAEPGFAICQRNYFIRGGTIIGYREHGSAAGCDRTAGRTE